MNYNFKRHIKRPFPGDTLDFKGNKLVIGTYNTFTERAYATYEMIERGTVNYFLNGIKYTIDINDLPHLISSLS